MHQWRHSKSDWVLEGMVGLYVSHFTDISLVCTSRRIYHTYYTTWAAAAIWRAPASSCTDSTKLSILQIDKTGSYWWSAHYIHSRDLIIQPATFSTSLGKSWGTSPFTAEEYPLSGSFGNTFSSYNLLHQKEAPFSIRLHHNRPYIKLASYYICHMCSCRFTYKLSKPAIPSFNKPWKSKL